MDQLAMGYGVEIVQELPTTYYWFGGIIVEMKEHMDSDVFHALLKTSMSKWKSQRKKRVWIKLPIDLVNLTEAAVKEGFWCVHAGPMYLMLLCLLPETTEHIYAYASHIASLVAIKDKRELLHDYPGSMKELIYDNVQQLPATLDEAGSFVVDMKEQLDSVVHPLLETWMLQSQLEQQAWKADDQLPSPIFGSSSILLWNPRVHRKLDPMPVIDVTSEFDPQCFRECFRELEVMKALKSRIDDKAEKMVRWELWGGLGYVVVQTATLMRLTYWELSWDVMAPICYFMASGYFMARYAFFMATSQEPSFDGVFKSRFRVKQMKMMKMEGFDVEKYISLKKACGEKDS